MNSKITYHQQVSYCGKPRCRKCREGTGHGPYWYAYQTVEGRTSRTYIGKHLPPEVQAQMTGNSERPSAHISEREQSTLRIYTLGQFRLERRNPRDHLEWQTVTDPSWQHQRVRALLGCLVSPDGRKLGREQIMDALWPDLDLETASSRLDRAVYSLRQVFEPSRGRPATSPFLLTEREMIVLAAQGQIWIDADAFEQLLTDAHKCVDEGEREKLLEEAMNLYAGEFLPEDTRNEWTRTRREQLHRAWVGLLLDLSDLRSKRGALHSSIEPLDRLIANDPTNEAAVQRLMILLEQQGRRGEALRAYKKLAGVLQQEYHIAPLPDTRRLYEALRTGAPMTREVPAREDSSTRGDEHLPARESAAREAAAAQIGRAHLSPLIGREHEIETLRALVTTTEHSARFRLPTQKRSSVSAFDPQRRPQASLVLGDVGIGKTRLAEEVSRDAKRRGWTVAWSRVYAQEGGIPYRMWTEVLSKAMEQGIWKREEVKKRPVFFQPLCALVPEMRELLGPVDYAAAQPEQEQLRLWDAVRELLLIICESTPLLIALDDLQWADNSSCELLAYLARRIYGLPIVMVGTCRDNELPQSHVLKSLMTDLQRENAVDIVALEPLSDDQIGSLVSHIQQVPEPMVQRIRSRAAGNPFFAEELARSVDLRVLEFFDGDLNGPNGSEGSAVPGAGGPEAELPDTITAVLELRMNRLSADCQRLLGKAAVLGGSFPFHVINEMEASTPGMDEDMVLELLEEGLHSGMLTEEGTGTRITYHFWHPLLVGHLYEQLSAARRALLHRRAANILKRVYEDQEEEHAAEILEHLVKGGADDQQVSRYAELAGDHAYTLSSFPDAEKYYRVALEQMREGEDWQRRAYFLEQLGECTRVRGKSEEAREFYEKAIEVHQRHHDPSLPEYQQEIQIQAILWCEIGFTWYNVGNDTKAQECYGQGEQLLSETGIVGGATWANIRLQQSYVIWQQGNYDLARSTANEALKLFEETFENPKRLEENISIHIRRILVGDPINLGRTHGVLGSIAASSSQCEDALKHLQTALAIYERYNYQRGISIVCGNIGDVYLRKAEHGLAQSFLRRSLNIAEQIGDTPVVSVTTSNLGILAMRLGNLEEAENWLKQGITLAQIFHDPINESWYSSYLSTVLLELGNYSDAKSHLTSTLKIARSTRISPNIGLALVTLGRMRIDQAIVNRKSTEENLQKDLAMTNAMHRAKATLQHALAIENMEAETKIEGQIELAYTMLLLGEVTEAQKLALQTLEDARKFELAWLVARAQSFLGSISDALGQYEQADKYFEQSARMFRKNDMKLEYARTLQYYGEALVRREGVNQERHQQGLKYLSDAREIFKECKAALDLQVIEQMLSVHEKATKV
jgi:DNA-binding SARP family transcriptional activator